MHLIDTTFSLLHVDDMMPDALTGSFRVIRIDARDIDTPPTYVISITQVTGWLIFHARQHEAALLRVMCHTRARWPPPQ